VIELRGVTVELGGRPVVAAVDAAVADGEWLALIGPNGAGKTTLLRAIARLVPCSGEIELAGRPVGALSRSELARLDSKELLARREEAVARVDGARVRGHGGGRGRCGTAVSPGGGACDDWLPLGTQREPSAFPHRFAG